jgi:hypothetical protein
MTIRGVSVTVSRVTIDCKHHSVNDTAPYLAVTAAMQVTRYLHIKSTMSLALSHPTATAVQGSAACCDVVKWYPAAYKTSKLRSTNHHNCEQQTFGE